MLNYIGRQETIPRERINDCIEKMCDEFCKWPIEATSQATLELHCEECPLNNLLIDEYWEKGEEDD